MASITTHEDMTMSDIAHAHRPHHEYTYRMPTPPRIVVPPPTITTEVPELHVSGVDPAEQNDINFLKEMDLESIVANNTLLDWSYERRRKAQMILPWLYLGPLNAAKDREWLKSEGITMVLAIRSQNKTMVGTMQIAKETCGHVESVEAATYFELIGQLSYTTRLINQHVAKVRRMTEATGNPQLGKVLVFCESGNEKSAAVVAAYLMETLDDFDFIKSMQVCQAQRFCVNFDDNVKNVLRNHWDILIARRSVAHSKSELMNSMALTNGLQQIVQQPSRQHQLHAPQHPSLKVKRSVEDMDDDMDMSDGGDLTDALRFAGRDVTPFMDS
ncbi:phosphatases II [Karstenula rhodostoma CBS 690.94]|uniref:Phosphatases II n=1 Tax=Karstenula rhodostoma CBS 690.94 TaxID=1392251 RepID=A0A9P4PU09_9PLEO|nr:phosphatases II [Karstenula rhodostoma CBS 690.94]